ncbi:hypothetical protein [Fimbriimonas ginsengisoli]|nr:hypothetical protein [Fimbriimonas ginsengisoli]
MLAACLPLLLSSALPAHWQTRGEKMGVFGYDVGPDFVRFDPSYRDRINHYKDRVEELTKALFARESKGKSSRRAHQLLVETHWLTHYTARYDQIEKKLAQVDDLIHGRGDTAVVEQDAEGSFGPYHEAWFYKLDATCDYLVNEVVPKKPLRFLDRINTPARLLAYLNSNLISDVAATGEDRRFELNLAGTDLLRLIEGSLKSGYKFHPALKKTIHDWVVNTWQDPQTGFFGAWYKTPTGLRKTADLSCTFHVAHYLDGKIGRWPQIVRTVLAMKDLEFPYGWLQEGKMSNHHDLDIVKLFRYGWPFMDARQKEQARGAIRLMMDHCLKETLKSDGSFNQEDMGSVGESYEFPVLFLAEVGFFHKEYRFWTNETFPQAAPLARRIANRIRETKLDDQEMQTALYVLESADGF